MQTGTNFSESFKSVYQDEFSFLENTVNQHPVSSLALFLLLQNYKQSGSDRFDDLLQRATVHFPNQIWLNYQLSGDESMKYIPKEKELEDNIPSETEFTNENFPVETESEIENSLETQPATTTHSSIQEEAIREMEKEEMVEFVLGEKADNFEENFIENNFNEKRELNTEILEEEKKEEEFADADIKIQDNSSQQNSQEELTEKTNEKIGIPNFSEEIKPDDQSEVLEKKGITGKNTDDPLLNMSQKEPDNEEGEQSVEFEPLHTIDYFASQGIIIKEEALMNDKLGKQMKSFTDWLKSMKKLHPGRLPEQNEVVEKIIQSSAELSNEDAGVLTEAMAEVLLKQGKSQKAIEMFEKLSLMNPSKSTYFAAKIESLKK
jgi:hypothetical protein